jgi:peptide/nickel transport system substrate-binding protein
VKRLLLALALLASGCPSRAVPMRDTAVIQVQQEPDTLDPYVSAMNATTALCSLFYSGLALVDDKGEWQPDLAEALPAVKDGGLRIVYHLRPGLKWQDGQALTAADVVATYKLIMDPTFPSLSRAGYDQLKAVTAPDARTVVLAFKAPYAPYMELFPFILPAHVLKASAHPEREAWNREPVGSGPYKLVSWSSGDRLVAHANPTYFRGAPAIPHLEVRFINQDMTAFNLWRSGELDLFQGASPTQFDFLQREAPRRVHQTPAPTWEHLVFNLDHPILKDVRVRRAIAHLVDRQRLNTAAYGGVFQPAWSEVPQGSWAYNRNVERRYTYDPAAAAKLLDEAGWKPGPGGIRVKDGQKLHLELLTTADRPSRELAGQLWRRQWKDVGIELDLEKRAASEVLGGAASGGRLAKGTFDLCLMASVSRPDPDTSFRWRSDQVPPAGQNRSRYRNPEVDKLLAQGQRTVDREARKPIYAKLAEQLTLDLPVLPLLYWVGIDATSQRLEGYRPNPTLRGNLWNVWEWKLKPS